MSNFEKNAEKMLGVPVEKKELQVIEPENNAIIAEPVNDSYDNDFDEAKESIKNAIKIGEEALFQMAKVAENTEHPRAFEVLSTLMRTMIDSNEKLLNLHKQKKEIKKEDNESQPEVVNNNLIMTTEQIQKLLKGEE